MRKSGRDITLVGCGYSAFLCEQAGGELAARGIDAEVIDIRVLNPFDATLVTDSVRKTGRVCVVDGGWRTAGFAAEVIARVCESAPALHSPPMRITLPDAPAPTSKPLETIYYPTAATVVDAVRAPARHRGDPGDHPLRLLRPGVVGCNQDRGRGPRRPAVMTQVVFEGHQPLLP